MQFHSILFEGSKDNIDNKSIQQPDFFNDLNLDQIIEAIIDGKQEYNLKPFFYTPLSSTNSIKYRHEIMKDLENGLLLKNIELFANKMREMRKYISISEKLYYRHQKERWFLDAVELYCEAVNKLASDLTSSNLQSKGLLAFSEYLLEYVKSDAFSSLQSDAKQLKSDLSTVRYCLLIKENRIKVRKYESEADYSIDIEKTFERFKQQSAKDYSIKFHESLDMNHVEAKILDFVAKLYPDIFHNLDNFCDMHQNFTDKTITTFDREIQFYIAYLKFISSIKQKGLKFCYPKITTSKKEVYNYQGFDLALAYKSLKNQSSIICNDFYLKDKERIFVVNGPNQGGKTTFARTFGQLHYISALGCPVPGINAKLFLYDKLFTHFEREENIENLKSKLEDDIARIHDIIDQATPNSIIIMNEIFTSTTLKDALFLSKKVMEKIISLDLLSVWVTFIDELAFFDKKIVSMVSTVDMENPSKRTYKIMRQPPDGLAYAFSIAEKYGLTYEKIKERINL